MRVSVPSSACRFHVSAVRCGAIAKEWKDGKPFAFLKTPVEGTEEIANPFGAPEDEAAI